MNKIIKIIGFCLIAGVALLYSGQSDTSEINDILKMNVSLLSNVQAESISGETGPRETYDCNFPYTEAYWFCMDENTTDCTSESCPF